MKRDCQNCVHCKYTHGSMCTCSYISYHESDIFYFDQTNEHSYATIEIKDSPRNKATKCKHYVEKIEDFFHKEEEYSSTKPASKKQKWVCARIYNYIHFGNFNVNKESQLFADNLTAQLAWHFIQDHESIHKDLKRKIIIDNTKERIERSKRCLDHRYESIYTDPYSVTDYLDCYDFGICPWGDS